MNIQEELKALKVRIAELEEQAKQGQDLPQVGDEYWCVGDSGSVDNYFYNAYYTDNDRLELGNFFKTEKSAIFALEKLKVEAELRKFSRPFIWGTENTAILFNGYDLKFDTRMSYVFQGAMYFESEKKAKEAIEVVGEERIKNYIFGSEE